MVLTHGIQKGLGRFLIRRKQRKQGRNRVVKNYKDIKSIAIIGAFESQDQLKKILALETKLKLDQKKVYVRLFASGSTLKDETIKKKVQLFGNKDLNFSYLPSSASMGSFTRESFDLMINICQKPVFQVLAQVGVSQAAFKVGKQFEEKHYADISIDQAEEVGFDAFIKQVLHYIGELNKG